MNSLGYSNPKFDAPQNQQGRFGEAGAFLDRLARQRLIVCNDQATPLLNLSLIPAVGLGLFLFPLSALVIGGMWVGILKLEVKQR